MFQQFIAAGTLFLHKSFMGALTEIEIFDCLSDNFRKAASHCDDLARLPAKGPTYRKLREELKLLEGACRQATAWRADARWLETGNVAAAAHKLAGEWLRGVPQRGGGRRPLPPGTMHPMFVRLAKFMRYHAQRAERMRTKKTGRIGPILPRAAATDLRETSPVGWTKAASGLLLPAGA